MFSKLSKKTLAKAALFKNTPVYVQFYITARCNLTCEQCNIIYANADVEECTIDEIKKVADNFAKMGVAIVLLTGGEPYARKDLPDIIRAFESRGVHVRMQTNGLANEEMIAASIEAGGCDISISLDSLKPILQDSINGGFNDTWHKALRAISLYTKYLPKEGSFASLGCVLQPYNVGDIEDVIRFGTKISWFTSLVPVHVTSQSAPRGFQTFDQNMKFLKNEYETVDILVENIRKMKKDGFLLYDSEQYLDDIKKYIKGLPTSWRGKNNNVCDSPNLYFALLPNAEVAPCCDYRIEKNYPAYTDEFPNKYYSAKFRDEIKKVTSACGGCMYGSYPEISIAMRFLAAKIQRFGNFFSNPPQKNWPISYDKLLETAEEIRQENRDRPISRKMLKMSTH
jgi:MoaA/NifB/PqqE/SkfB family radical SAM enzyme